MKQSIKRLMCVILSVCLCLAVTGCNSSETESATYFHIDSNREFEAAIPVKPLVQSSYSQNFAVFSPAEYGNTSSITKLCINNTTNEIVYGENPFAQIYPASITKIMTALLVLERGNLEDSVTVTEEIDLGDPMAVSLNLQVGDTITVNELLHGLLITSANDCAVVLGRYIAGSDAAFMELMNQRTAELGATHTHFVNPHGLHSEEHYTTGYDLYLIYKELIQHDKFQEVSGLSQYTFTYVDGEGTTIEIPISNSNQFITQTYTAPEGMAVVCGKTGTTDEAGCCLIIEATDADNQDYIVLVCGADTKATLYTYMQELLSQTGLE